MTTHETNKTLRLFLSARLREISEEFFYFEQQNLIQKIFPEQSMV
jgi:hypothetical protein